MDENITVKKVELLNLFVEILIKQKNPFDRFMKFFEINREEIARQWEVIKQDSLKSSG